MPNWCDNEITIKGTIKRLKEFDEQFKKEHVVYEGGTVYTKDLEGFLKSHENLIDYKIVENIDYKTVEKFANTSNPTDENDVFSKIHYITSEDLMKDKYSFSNFIPDSKETFLNGWCDWNIDNWGTKWDISVEIPPEEIEVWAKEKTDEDKIDSIFYYFNTAWSPVVPVIEEMAKQYPDLTFVYKYQEDGCEFAGVMEFTDGELQCEDIFDDTEEYKEFILRVFDIDMIRCKDCKHLMEIWEVDENEDKCTECESSNLADV